MGKIYTFYSYKGGVGRSMALANIAVLLRRLGYNVLMVDWDLLLVVVTSAKLLAQMPIIRLSGLVPSY